MRNITLIFMFCSLLLTVSCMQKNGGIESEQSIQDIMAKSADFEDLAKPLINESLVVENKTKTTPQNITTTTTPILNEMPAEEKETIPLIERKCRNSAILYGGCIWNEPEHKTFNLKIKSSSRKKIPGVWMIITGESGGVIYTKRPEDLMSEALRTYALNYEDMKKEVGTVKKIEILPIEDINGTEYACLNQRVYTIPEVYCKESEAIVVNDDGTINKTR